MNISASEGNKSVSCVMCPALALHFTLDGRRIVVMASELRFHRLLAPIDGDKKDRPN